MLPLDRVKEAIVHRGTANQYLSLANAACAVSVNAANKDSEYAVAKNTLAGFHIPKTKHVAVARFSWESTDEGKMDVVKE